MKQFVTEQYHEQALKSLSELIHIPSVPDGADSGKGRSFDEKMIEALDEILEISEKLGFRTFKDPEGYYDYSGISSGDELFGILCHMDVVPTDDENNWETKSFDPAAKDGWLIGCGFQGDKGPSIAAMHAVKVLVNADVESKAYIRFTFGTNEEDLWRCSEKYSGKEKDTTQGFALDAEFPLIYAEKGLLQTYLTGPETNDFSVKVGGALNVVPGVAPHSDEKTPEAKGALKKRRFDFEEQSERVVVPGRSIHAEDVVQGMNAISRLAIALSKVFDSDPINFLGKLVQENAAGETVAGKTGDEQSGELTMNFVNLEITPEQAKIGVDMGTPVTFKKEDLIAKLAKTTEKYELSHEEFGSPDLLYIPLDSELVKNLLGTYRGITGDMTESFISGGATLARATNQCVAFSTILPDTPDFVHQANERQKLSNMYEATEIYAEAVYRLCAK